MVLLMQDDCVLCEVRIGVLYKKIQISSHKIVADLFRDAVHLGKFDTTSRKISATKNIYLCVKCQLRSRVTILARDEMFFVV